MAYQYKKPDPANAAVKSVQYSVWSQLCRHFVGSDASKLAWFAVRSGLRSHKFHSSAISALKEAPIDVVQHVSDAVVRAGKNMADKPGVAELCNAILRTLPARHDADGVVLETGVRSVVPEAHSSSPTGLPSPRRWFKDPSGFEPCIDAVQTCRRARGLPELIANEFGAYMVTHDPIDMSIFTAVYKAEVDAGRIVEEKDDGDA